MWEGYLIRYICLCACVSYIPRLGNKVKLSWRLTSITTLENGGYSLTYETPSGTVSLQSKSVVMTIPSYVASTILRPLSVCSLYMYACFFIIHLCIEVSCLLFHTCSFTDIKVSELLGKLFLQTLIWMGGEWGRIQPLNSLLVLEEASHHLAWVKETRELILMIDI